MSRPSKVGVEESLIEESGRVQYLVGLSHRVWMEVRYWWGGQMSCPRRPFGAMDRGGPRDLPGKSQIAPSASGGIWWAVNGSCGHLLRDS